MYNYVDLNQLISSQISHVLLCGTWVEILFLRILRWPWRSWTASMALHHYPLHRWHCITRITVLMSLHCSIHIKIRLSYWESTSPTRLSLHWAQPALTTLYLCFLRVFTTQTILVKLYNVASVPMQNKPQRCNKALVEGVGTRQANVHVACLPQHKLLHLFILCYIIYTSESVVLYLLISILLQLKSSHLQTICQIS